MAIHSSGQIVFSITHMIHLNVREEEDSITIIQRSYFFLPAFHFISLFHIFLFHYFFFLPILDLLLSSFPRFSSSFSHSSFMYISYLL